MNNSGRNRVMENWSGHRADSLAGMLPTVATVDTDAALRRATCIRSERNPCFGENVMKKLLATLCCIIIPLVAIAGDNSYKITYDRGSLPGVKAGTRLSVPNLGLSSSLATAEVLNVDDICDRLQEDREIIKHDFDETSTLMDVLKKRNLHKATGLRNLHDVTDLMNAIDNVMERTASEGYLLAVYDRVTSREAQQDTEKLIREHYADLADLTGYDVESTHEIARGSRLKELAALATKVEADIQRIADRYQALKKE